jgi:hypothetical protein
MRFTQAREAEVIEYLRRHPDECLTIPALERPDGSVVIRRDGLEIRLHRYLWREMAIGPRLTRYIWLLPKCATRGCVNPRHYEKSTRPKRGRTATRCPNGHEYTPANTIADGPLRCRACKAARDARRRKTSRRKGYCAKGHRLTKTNIYTWTDGDGRVHRRCRTCKLAAARAARSTTTTEREAA